MRKLKTTESKMSKSYEAFFNFFSADDARRLVLLPKGMVGTDTAVLCHVADGLYNEAGITCVQVDDNFDATKNVIDEFVKNLGETFNPDRNYVSILVFDIGNVDYAHIAELSTEEHRIITTFIPCDNADSGDYDGVDRVVILPGGNIVRCVNVEDWSTSDSALREIGRYLKFYVKHICMNCVDDTILDAIKMFVKTSKCDTTGNAEMSPFFAKSCIMETDIVNNHEMMKIVPLWAVLKNKTMHTLLYNWYKHENQLDEYIMIMTKRIINGELFVDPKFARAIRDAVLVDSLSSNGDDNEYEEFRKQLKDRTPPEFETILENALRKEFDIFLRGYHEIIDSMICVSSGGTTFADVLGLKLQSISPTVVTYEGDPTISIPYEDAIISHIYNTVRAINPSSQMKGFSRRGTSKHVIPLLNDKKELVTSGNVSVIDMIIEHHPQDSGTVKIWTFNNPSSSILGSTAIKKSLQSAIEEKFPNKSGVLQSVSGDRFYTIPDRIVIDLEHPYG